MSFDFEFHPRASAAIDPTAVRACLSARPGWTVDPGSSAVYENLDTGVYFVLDINGPGDHEPPLVAIVNLVRPSFFIREIEFELRSIASAFDLRVFDPQDELWGPEPLTTEWLSSRWWAANATSHTILEGEPESALALPQSRLDAAWWWNFGRQQLQASFVEDVFVPSIMLINTSTGVRTAAVWSDAIPVILPRVDDVLVYRDRLAPRKLFRSARSDLVRVDGERVAALLAPYSIVLPDRVEHRVRAIQPEVERWVKDLTATVRDFEGVPWDQVHDAELVPWATA